MLGVVDGQSLTFRKARELHLQKVGNSFFLTSTPIKELEKIIQKNVLKETVVVVNELDLSSKTATLNGTYELQITTQQAADFELKISNSQGDEVLVGYNKINNSFYVDRTKSGIVNFEKNFDKRTIAPRIANDNKISLKLLLDATSVEVFADNGLTAITNLFFAKQPLTYLSIKTKTPLSVEKIRNLR